MCPKIRDRYIKTTCPKSGDFAYFKNEQKWHLEEAEGVLFSAPKYTKSTDSKGVFILNKKYE